MQGKLPWKKKKKRCGTVEEGKPSTEGEDDYIREEKRKKRGFPSRVAAAAKWSGRSESGEREKSHLDQNVFVFCEGKEKNQKKRRRSARETPLVGGKDPRSAKKLTGRRGLRTGVSSERPPGERAVSVHA